jgi:hypothetical protein
VGQLRSIAVLLCLAVALCGCSAYFTTVTDPPTSGPGAPGGSAGAGAVASPAPIGSFVATDLPTLAVTTTEYAFELPPSIPAGPTRVVVTNVGSKDHSALIVRLDGDATYGDVRSILTGPTGEGLDSVSSPAGGLAFVPPDASRSVVIDFRAGTYVLICYVRDDDGRPHFLKGQTAPLEVTDPASRAALPPGEGALIQREFSFEGVTSLTAGRHTITIRNDGSQPHEANIARLADGVTVQDIQAALRDEIGLPGTPWLAVGGAAAIAPGDSQLLDVDLTPGEYAFFCVWPDRATHKLHLDLGMVAPLTVR